MDVIPFTAVEFFNEYLLLTLSSIDTAIFRRNTDSSVEKQVYSHGTSLAAVSGVLDSSTASASMLC
jgi:hypothetical protein